MATQPLLRWKVHDFRRRQDTGSPVNNPPTGANIAIYEIGVIPSALSSGEKSFSCRRRSLS